MTREDTTIVAPPRRAGRAPFPSFDSRPRCLPDWRVPHRSLPFGRSPKDLANGVPSETPPARSSTRPRRLLPRTAQLHRARMSSRSTFTAIPWWSRPSSGRRAPWGPCRRNRGSSHGGRFTPGRWISRRRRAFATSSRPGPEEAARRPCGRCGWIREAIVPPAGAASLPPLPPGSGDRLRGRGRCPRDKHTRTQGTGIGNNGGN